MYIYIYIYIYIFATGLLDMAAAQANTPLPIPIYLCMPISIYICIYMYMYIYIYIYVYIYIYIYIYIYMYNPYTPFTNSFYFCAGDRAWPGRGRAKATSCCAFGHFVRRHRRRHRHADRHSAKRRPCRSADAAGRGAKPFFLFFHLSYHTLTPQQQSAESRNSAGAEALAVARRPKEASREKTRPPPVLRGYSPITLSSSEHSLTH